MHLTNTMMTMNDTSDFFIPPDEEEKGEPVAEGDEDEEWDEEEVRLHLQWLHPECYSRFSSQCLPTFCLLHVFSTNDTTQLGSRSHFTRLGGRSPC